MYYEKVMKNISAQINTRETSFIECFLGVFSDVNAMFAPDYGSHLRCVLSV